MTTKSKIPSNHTPQFDFFAGSAKPAKNIQPISAQKRFTEPDANDIYLGQTPLRQHLQLADQQAPLIIADILKAMDWTDFESLYSANGRPAYSPRCMVGIILYGIMQAVTSLRALERLARLDVGVMWISGGIYPDHANIGRFINRHANQLSGTFFQDLTRAVLQRTGGSTTRVAVDGTLIEAACSNYNLIKEEAALSNVQEAQKTLEKAPGDESLQKDLTHKKNVYDSLLSQKKKQKRRGKKDTSHSRISPTEPEAARHKMKRGRGYAQGYTPSILANDQRLVVGMAVDPTNEASVIPYMLDQAVEVAGQPDEMLADGGYFTDAVINTTLDRDISLLCPESGKPGKPQKNRNFHKGHFLYKPTDDVYICPAGQTLKLISRPANPEAPKAQWVYGGASCHDCPLKSRCTKSKKGRSIRRFAIDEAKDALRSIMEHPSAQKVYKYRQGMVEPVFGYLRTVQGLNRFRRRGLEKVKTEFSLHILAYNLSRAVALSLRQPVPLLKALIVFLQMNLLLAWLEMGLFTHWQTNPFHGSD